MADGITCVLAACSTVLCRLWAVCGRSTAAECITVCVNQPHSVILGQFCEQIRLANVYPNVVFYIIVFTCHNIFFSKSNVATRKLCRMLTDIMLYIRGGPNSEFLLVTRLNGPINFNNFTARRVCIARTMPWQDVCPSVCPSHAGILPKRLNTSSTFFHHR